MIVGDASRFLHKVAGPFDLIFQDGSKQLYEPLLDRLVGAPEAGRRAGDRQRPLARRGRRRLRRRPSATPRDTDAIRRYNDRLATDTRLLTTFLPLGDGVAMSVKLRD